MNSPCTPPDFNRVKTYSIKDRKSLVSKDDFASPWKKGGQFSDFIASLPAILAGNDMRSVIQAIVLAAQNKRQVCFAMGGHVIKTGMNPVIIDLMEKKILTMISMNGSGIIHDLEEGGFIQRERVGRQNRYHVLTDQSLRHPIESHRDIGDLLKLINK